MREVVIVGAGAVGMAAAFEALQLGHKVNLIERESAQPSPKAISWEGTRIVRDEGVAGSRPRNTKLWCRILGAIGAEDAAVQGVTHVFGRPSPLATACSDPGAGTEAQDTHWRQEVEKAAFVLDTPKVYRRLLNSLRRDPKFSSTRGTPVCAFDEGSKTVRCADGRRYEGDFVLITAGHGSGDILRPMETPQARRLVQVCAVLKTESACGGPSGMPAFIHHAGGEGAWGTPAVECHPAKISAPDLCFEADEDARRFAESKQATRLFIERCRKLLPGLDETQVSHWSFGRYSATRADPVVRRGKLRAHMACNGGPFKRAPMIASKLLSGTQVG